MFKATFVNHETEQVHSLSYSAHCLEHAMMLYAEDMDRRNLTLTAELLSMI